MHGFHVTAVDHNCNDCCCCCCLFLSVVTAKPKITSVVHVDGLAGNLKFAPNQPSQHHKYRVCRYSIQSRLENNHWVEVYSKVVPQGVSMNREECVTFPLCLVEEGKECVYQVVMHYFNVDQEVKSEVCRIRLKPSGKRV